MAINRKQVFLMEDEVASALEEVSLKYGLSVQQIMSGAIFIFTKLFTCNNFDVIISSENGGIDHKISIDCDIKEFYGEISDEDIDHEA